MFNSYVKLPEDKYMPIDIPLDHNQIPLNHVQSHANTIKPLWKKGKLKLIGGFTPSEKYEFVNWDDDIPNSGRKKKRQSVKFSANFSLWLKMPSLVLGSRDSPQSNKMDVPVTNNPNYQTIIIISTNYDSQYSMFQSPPTRKKKKNSAAWPLLQRLPLPQRQHFAQPELVDPVASRDLAAKLGSSAWLVQWVDLRENLEETIDFPMKYWICLYFFP